MAAIAVHNATDRLWTATVTVLLADAALTIWPGFTIPSGLEEAWRGAGAGRDGVVVVMQSG